MSELLLDLLRYAMLQERRGGAGAGGRGKGEGGGGVRRGRNGAKSQDMVGALVWWSACSYNSNDTNQHVKTYAYNIYFERHEAVCAARGEKEGGGGGGGGSPAQAM